MDCGMETQVCAEAEGVWFMGVVRIPREWERTMEREVAMTKRRSLCCLADGHALHTIPTEACTV